MRRKERKHSTERSGKAGKRAGFMLFSGLLAALVSVQPVFAMPPYDHIPEGCSEETWNRMQDNLVEWEELGDLVQYYNPTYTSAFDAADGSVTMMESAFSSFVQDMHDSMETIDETMDGLLMQQKLLQGLPAGSVIDGNGTTREQALAALSAGLAEAKAGRDQIRSGIRQSERSIKNAPASLERQLRPVKKQLTFAMEGIMLGYEQLRITRQMSEKQAALYQTMYEMQKNLQENGMATDYAVLSAKNDLEKAKQSLSMIDSNLELIRRNLGLQLGWSAEKLPEIGSVPEPDPSFVDTTNPDADKTAAIMHNKELREAEKVKYSSSYGFELRDKAANETEGKLISKMDSLYADMKQKKALYEAAKTTLRKAELTRDGAKRQMELGMLGRAEYEAQELAYISYEASFELAKLNLFQSINTYRRAVDGVVTIE